MTLRQARKIERRGGSLNARTNARAARRLFQWDGWRWPIRVNPKKSRDAMRARFMSKYMCHTVEADWGERMQRVVEGDMARRSWPVDVFNVGFWTEDEVMGKEPDGNR